MGHIRVSSEHFEITNHTLTGLGCTRCSWHGSTLIFVFETVTGLRTEEVSAVVRLEEFHCMFTAQSVRIIFSFIAHTRREH